MSEEETKATTATTGAQGEVVDPPQEEGADSAPAAAAGVAGEEEVVEESTATFEPVVRLEEVDVQTGEEEEELLYSQRAKLFVFGETLLDVGTGNKVWKERGVGNIRLLRHKEHQRIRVLMRQEKTHKLIVNHALLPDLVLVPHTTSDRSYVWRAEDFSDGQSLVETAFCVRFADSDIANAFKDNFTKYQQEVAALDAGLDKEEVDQEAKKETDEATAALQGLSTNDSTSAAE